ncbi:hypothetical protein [Salinisphaera sp. Q1T1-3]|uniref:hypothetical protein n=1 Tax=Salinisphaera sp. Q1T1-3 TaxID=2321229 RepID=UPI000E714886|nr:hypothetical protein [Salinisphaera sp. Q1T1-3]RJS93050.1 hypothetical protein D3260_09115 [Salinisphaera sp. Q1T1-3]
MAYRDKSPMGRWAALAAGLIASVALGGCATLQRGGSDSGNDDAPSAATLEQHAGALEATPGQPHADARKRLADALSAIYSDGGTARPLHYVADFTDLNGDGHDEALVYVFGPNECANGCDLYVFQRQGDRYEVLNRVPTARPPLVAFARRHAGWRDLGVGSMDADGNPSSLTYLTFAAGQYQTAESTPADDAQRTPLIERLSFPGAPSVTHASR